MAFPGFQPAPSPGGSATFHVPVAEDWGVKCWTFAPREISANHSPDVNKSYFLRMRCDTVETISKLYMGSWTFALPPGLRMILRLYTCDHASGVFTKRLEKDWDGDGAVENPYLREIDMGSSYTLDGTEIPYGMLYVSGGSVPSLLANALWDWTAYILDPLAVFMPLDLKAPMAFVQNGISADSFSVDWNVDSYATTPCFWMGAA